MLPRVLTEVIESAARSLQPPLGRPTQVGPTPAELQELERRLKESILDAIGPYVANILEEPLRVRLEAHLQRTLATLSSQVRADIETLIRSVTYPIFDDQVPLALTGASDPEQALRKLRRLHAGVLCMTLGEDGAAALEGDRLAVS